MAFKKGHKKSGGIKKGQKQKRTLLWDQLGEKLLNGTTEKVMEYLDTLSGKELFMAYAELLEYFKPKQRRNDNVNSGNITIVVRKNVPKK